MDLKIWTEDGAGLIENTIVYGVGGIFTEEISGNPSVEGAIIGHVVGKTQHSMFQPAFSW